MSKSLNGLSSSRRPPDSLMMSFERADSWFEREKDKVWIQCNVKGAHFLFYLECISCIDGRFGESLDQDVSHVVHLQFKTLRAWMHLLERETSWCSMRRLKIRRNRPMPTLAHGILSSPSSPPSSPSPSPPEQSDEWSPHFQHRALDFQIPLRL